MCPVWAVTNVPGLDHGAAAMTVPDNTKTAVETPCRYDPVVQATYEEMAAHYGTAIVPARARKPRDKAKVEAGVLIAQRWILAELRNHRFFSVAGANEAILAKVEEMNDRPFEKLDSTRRVLFETLDRPALKPLPATRYEFAEWSRPKVNIDYHIEVDRHFYSVPYLLRRFRPSSSFVISVPTGAGCPVATRAITSQSSPAPVPGVGFTKR